MGLGLGLGLEIVLGLGLGTGLALGLRVGWVFMYYGPKLFELNSLWQRIQKVKQNCAENHSFFPKYVPTLDTLIRMYPTLKYSRLISMDHDVKKKRN